MTDDPPATYQIPTEWALHVDAHRTATTVGFPEPSSATPVEYAFGPVLAMQGLRLRRGLLLEWCDRNSSREDRVRHALDTTWPRGGGRNDRVSSTDLSE